MATTSPGVTPSWTRPCASETTSSTNCSPVLRLFPATVTGKSRRKVNSRLRHWQIWAIRKLKARFFLKKTVIIYHHQTWWLSHVIITHVSLFYWWFQNFFIFLLHLFVWLLITCLSAKGWHRITSTTMNNSIGNSFMFFDYIVFIINN
jgi:hypothetical protein